MTTRDELVTDFLQSVATCPRCASCADVAKDLLKHHPAPVVAQQETVAKVAHEVEAALNEMRSSLGRKDYALRYLEGAFELLKPMLAQASK